MNKIKILSFGGGVQTTYLALTGNYDILLFADTQGEHPKTYDNIKRFNPKIVSNGSLEQFCLEKKTIPYRRFRWCTDKFKLRPMKKFLKEINYEYDELHVGISYDELERMKEYFPREKFPLVDNKITRQECIKYLNQKGLEIIKSGCFFCPFQRKEGWRDLAVNYPELYKRACILEENSPNILSNKPLRMKQWNDYLFPCGVCLT